MPITVTLMLSVPTLLVNSPVPVTRDTPEVGSHVLVSSEVQNYMHSMNILSSDIDGCVTNADKCDTNLSVEIKAVWNKNKGIYTPLCRANCSRSQ